MDDYAKMWLQLAFPFYLIFIATSLIITSRYSTTIQRLTARGALPVLATLFLLSYTKTLIIVSSVLFSYSKVIHLPSKQVETVWSIDANISLLEVRFILLFIVCTILFLILVPFNIILLFTRSLSRFTLITKFKPLLDATKDLTKTKRITGLEYSLNMLRVVLFAVSSLDRNINLIIGIVLLILIEAIHSTVRPLKCETKNCHENFFTINTLILFAVTQYSQEATNMIAVNVMIGLAMVHFALIIIYHIITYAISGVTRNKLQLHISTLINQIIRKQNKPSSQHFRLQNSVKSKIPEATVYNKCQEPLVFQD